jgi:transposase
LPQFLCGLVRHSPDLYLAELQEILEDRLGVEVNESTIWRSLRRCGFTMKKVLPFAIMIAGHSTQFYFFS